MKKLLTILFGVLLGVSGVHAANLTINAKAYVFESTGGQVAANQSTETPTSGWGDEATGTFTETPDSSSWGTNKWNGYALYYHAKSLEGYTFIGWSNDNNESHEHTGLCYNASSTKTFSQLLSGTTANDVVTRYAIFKPIIDFPLGNEIVLYKTPQGTLSSDSLEITLTKTTGLTMSCSSDLFTVSKTENFTEGYARIAVSKNASATDDIELGEKAYTITLTPNNSDLTQQEYYPKAETIYITIREAPVITFIPADEGGSYTYQQKNVGGRVIPVTQEISLGTFSMSEGTIELVATSASGYRFNKWIINETNEDGTITSIEYKDSTKVCVFTKNTTVQPKFIETKYARFAVKGVDGVYYDDLNEGITAAQSSDSKVVYVYQSGYLAAGNYTIPSSVTLLVPGDDDNTVKTGDVDVETDFVSNSNRSNIECKKYLTFEDNTSLTVAGGGAISIYAKLSKTQGWNGTPYTYGRIDLGKNCYITIESGAVLSALGYIIGAPETSSVTAKNGATVYEAFQITDWRGGNATAAMIGGYANLMLGRVDPNDQKVFPAGQFYVQSIETKLVLEYGAVEKVATAVGVAGMDVHANAPFFVPDNDSYTSGFIRLGEDTKLVKYYDKTDDRTIYKIIGQANGSSFTTATIDKIVLSFNVGLGVNLSTAVFTLPIHSGMDIVLEDVIATTNNAVAYMPSSNVKINNNSELIIKSSQYIYDMEEGVYSYTDYADDAITKPTTGETILGYFGMNNWALKTVPYTPGNTEYVNDTYVNAKSVKKRTPENLTDATWVVDGKVTINGGGLYTTSSGADITSNGNGRVYYGVKGSETETYQALQLSNEIAQYPAIAITNAQLHNDETKNPDEPYSAGASATAGETYTYIESLGKWILPQTLTISGKTGNTFAITLPKDTIQNVVCNVGIPEGKEDEVSINNFKVSLASNSYFSLVGTAVYDAAAQTLSIPVKYTAQNKHNVGNPNVYDYLVVECIDLTSNSTVHTENISLSATEDYTPKFNVLIDGTTYVDGDTYSTTIVGTGVDETVQLGVTITAENSNVAQSLATFTQTSASPFAFKYGTKSTTPYAAAALEYTPTAAGEHTGAVALTATYTDANGLAIDTTVTITFNAKVSLKNNTLAFATFPSPIFDNTDAFDLLDASTNNAGSKITISTSENGIVEITGTGTADDPYKVNPVGMGTVTITATQEDSRIVMGKTISTTITILSSTIYPVPFCVNSKDEFNKHTCGGSFVSYNTTNNTVDFNSTTATSEWIFRFNGTPDELTFTPTGTNLWNVQQRSSETAEWKNIVTWASLTSGETVTCQLEPTTCQVRIQYGSANAEVGTLQNVCVSELLISANTSKMYMPIYADKVSEKSFILTHTEDAQPAITLTSGLSYTAERSENLGTEGAPYYKTTVTITVPANTAAGDYSFTAKENNTTVSVAICAYTFPQELPIKLATDLPANGDRYYFVTTASSYAQWDATNRQIIFQNPGAQLTRSVTFAFNGAPSIITFDLSDVNGDVTVTNADWTIEESTDGVNFYTATLARDSVEDNTLVQELNYTTRYVRVKYNSILTSEVRLSNLVIEGYPSVIVNPESLHFTSEDTDTNPKKVAVIAINLKEVDFAIDNVSAFQVSLDTTYSTTDWQGSVTATESTHPTALGTNKVDTIFLNVKWLKTTALDEGELTIRNKTDNSVLAVVPLMGSEGYLTQDKANNSGIYTGIPEGNTFHGSEYSDYTYHQVDLTNTFTTDGIALFDYLFIYGETTPADGSTDITAPKTGGTLKGSNAVTPYYIYKKATNNDGVYKGYQFVDKVDNANVANKKAVGGVVVTDDNGVVYIDVRQESDNAGKLSIYMTGFCPYATTDYQANQEGVFLFRGKHGDTLDIYMEDLHVLSRNKTQNGNAFYGDKQGGVVFSEGYTRGSGGVLVFENIDTQSELAKYSPFEVTIHTRGNNLLNSNYGCFFGFAISGSVAMKAYQVSSPIHVHMNSKDHVGHTKTTLNFTDEWPSVINSDNSVEYQRTNGYLALKKPNNANNAPSIDLGNKYTTVNFKGGQVCLQNSQIVSDTYKTTLAISHRSGYFGSGESGIQLCYGIGTDSVGGTVNFLDGTVTVEPMEVKSAYRQYYLMDTTVVTDAEGNTTVQELTTTSCLRTPKNTYVRGGSICRVRACQHVTSKGGAPKDRETGSLLGQYVYTLQGNDQLDATTKLATISDFPGNINGLDTYHSTNGYTYGLKSVTPDANNQCYFWIPGGFGGVTAEQDKLMATWKACMTEISAGISGVVEGSVGGDTPIEENEEVKYLMFCQIDQNIHDVITAGTTTDGVTDYSYLPPFEVPSAAKSYFNGAEYTRYDLLTNVSDSLQYQVLSDVEYTITDRVYFVTTATADIWHTFTAPFDVANIYVVETFAESELEKMGTRAEILQKQASNNADFAAFFAVAMAMGTDKDFDGIYQSYRKWAYTQDTTSHLYDGDLESYDLRNMQVLEPYVGKNWRTANFYLNHNKGNWIYDETNDDDVFTNQWKKLSSSDLDDNILLHKNETYSLMFPYCTNCETTLEDRTDWDYWSGKFLVFESTEGEQTIEGRNYLNDTIAGHIFTIAPENGELILTGNNTFAQLKTTRENVYLYNSYAPEINQEYFEIPETEGEQTIYPTTAFLYGSVPDNALGMPARRILCTGEIIYGSSDNGNNNGTTGGHIPTVGGGNDLFITAIANGINIAVAAPQQVRVLSSTGAVIYSGMVQTSVDVQLPGNGIYVVSGENEVQKILH